MAREYKSLRFNLENEVDVPHHREHRAKKCRNNYKSSRNLAYRLYKEKKNQKFDDFDDENLLFY